MAPIRKLFELTVMVWGEDEVETVEVVVSVEGILVGRGVEEADKVTVGLT